MRVHVAFTPAEATHAPVAIAVDVLRATSTICAALAAGFEEVVCATEVELVRGLAGAGTMLAGERGCVRIDGFDFGNSPAELAEADGRGVLALTTTNGTQLLVASAERAQRVYVGALVNLAAVVAAVHAAEPEEVAVLCAGVEGRFALDDAYCAGRIVQALGGTWSDAATAAARLADGYGSATEALAASESAENLRRVGLEPDVEWCARASVLALAPVVREAAAGLVRVSA